MSRYNSTAQESNLSKDKTSYIEDFDEQAVFGTAQSRHVAISERQTRNNNVEGGTDGIKGSTPHPHAAAHAAPEGVELVEWDGPEDPQNPYAWWNPRDPAQSLTTKSFNWSKSYRWAATLTTCFISILFGIPAGAYGAASEQMSTAWHIDESSFRYLEFALVSWNIGAAIFPLVFVPLTENTGRMPGYWVSYVIFVIFLIPSAVSQNFATIVVTRFFGGGASSVAINLVGGTLTDIWKGEAERSLPMSIFGMTSVVGIALGPFIGGAIQSGLNWRWIYWIQIIVDAALLPLFWLILSETRGDTILAKRAKKLPSTGRPNVYARSELNKPGMLEALTISFMRPTKMLATVFVVISFTLWVSFAWGILFLFQSSVPLVFSELYGFDTFQTGCIQLALSFGAIVATFINPIQDRLYLKSSTRNMERPGKPIPEARLYFAVPGSLLFTAGMFWYGWASWPDVPWIFPALGIGCVGMGIFSIYLAVVNYLADAYQKYAASALSAASMGRNVFGAFIPLATPALYKNLGLNWASTLLGFIGLLLSAVPVILLAKGEAIRARSPFMLDATYDDGEGMARKESLAERHAVERKMTSVLPWSDVRVNEVPARTGRRLV